MKVGVLGNNGADANAKTLTDNTYTQEQIEKLIDPYMTLKHAVARGWSGDWDTFTIGNAHNALFYRRANDGRWQFFQWDSDQGFQMNNANSPFYGDRVRSWLEKPYNKRLFNYYMVEMIENYTKDSPRFFSYLRAEQEDLRDQENLNRRGGRRTHARSDRTYPIGGRS